MEIGNKVKLTGTVVDYNEKKKMAKIRIEGFCENKMDPAEKYIWVKDDDIHDVKKFSEGYFKAVEETCQYLKYEWATENLITCDDFDKVAEQLKENYGKFHNED